MARRRMSMYGTAPMPTAPTPSVPLPPPPDGRPPVRLPVGSGQPPPDVAPTNDGNEDIIAQLMALLDRHGEA